MRQCILVDGSHLAYRCAYSFPQLTNSAGKPTGVIYGFLKLLNDVQSKLKTTDYDVVICWEGDMDKTSSPVQQWRKQHQASYKANREITPEKIAIQKQMRQLPKILDILGYRQIAVTGLEADDLVGVLSYALSQHPKVDSVKILSGDKDFFQCVSDKVSVLRPEGKKLVVYKPSTVKKSSGIDHTQWAAYKAFVGDKSDHYDGVPGVGPVAAARLVSLGADPRRSWESQPKAVKEAFAKLESKWKQARKCWVLSYIPRRADYRHFPELSKQSITAQLPKVIQKRRRVFTRDEYRKSLQAFTEICANYDFVSFIADRRKFYGNAKIVA